MNLHHVTIHVWPYGIELWTEVEFEGDDVERLKVILGRPTVDGSERGAIARVEEGVRKLGIDPAVLPAIVVEHHEERKRRPPIAEIVVETGCEFEQDGVSTYYGGACPVQGQGLIDGHPFYYRARGRGWDLDVFEQHEVLDEDLWPDPIFSYRERPYAHPDGGWLQASESKLNILKAAEAFRARNKETRCDKTT